MLPGVKATVPALFPRVTPVMEGALGAVAATKLDEGADAVLAPALFVAVAVQRYVRPLDRGATVIDEVRPIALRRVPPLVDVQVTL